MQGNKTRGNWENTLFIEQASLFSINFQLSFTKFSLTQFIYSSSVLHHKEKYGVHKQISVDQNKNE
jgi:hypothetical protein